MYNIFRPLMILINLWYKIIPTYYKKIRKKDLRNIVTYYSHKNIIKKQHSKLIKSVIDFRKKRISDIADIIS